MDNLSPQFFSSRRKKLLDKLPSDGPIVLSAHGLLKRTRDDDTYPFVQESNFWYLTGLNEPDLVLVIDRKEEYLILPSRSLHHKIFAVQTDPGKLQQISGIKKIYAKKEGWAKLSATLKNTKTFYSQIPPRSYDAGYDAYTNPAARRMIQRIKSINRSLILTDISKDIVRLRMIKTDQEVKNIKTAIDLNAEMLQKVYGNFAEYKSERDIEKDMAIFCLENDVEYSFNPIIAGGKNACVLHYNSNNAKLNNDELVLIDSGIKSGGYCSDITRCFSLYPSSRQLDVYKAVKEVQNFAYSILKPGITFQKYEQSVGLYMTKKLKEIGVIKSEDPKAMRRYYPHGTSHSLGIDVHDPSDYTQPLKENMVITVEPGIYIPEEKIGIRVEDDVLITKTGVEILSKNIPSDLAGEGIIK